MLSRRPTSRPLVSLVHAHGKKHEQARAELTTVKQHEQARVELTTGKSTAHFLMWCTQCSILMSF